MNFIHLYEAELKNLLQLIALSGEGGRGTDDGGSVTNVQYKV
jgi:hypothetical protein